MPELPDLQVIQEYLAPRLAGVSIQTAQVRRPLLIRNLLGGNPAEKLTNRQFTGVTRRGKFLLFAFDNDTNMVIHPMLAGRLHYGELKKKDRVRDALVLLLNDGRELRYHDAKDMGKIYLTANLDQVPGMANLGPEANDPQLTLELFQQRIRRCRGEVKRALTTQTFVTGIGNAYADEICWQARVYPFRKRNSLSAEELAKLYTATQTVLSEAIETLRGQVGDAIHVEIRDFLQVHGRAGQPCPRCGRAISQVKRKKSATHFCRTCQPGLMVGGRR